MAVQCKTYQTGGGGGGGGGRELPWFNMVLPACCPHDEGVISGAVPQDWGPWLQNGHGETPQNNATVDKK